MPQLSYLGFDIIITDDGFKIIEINSLSALTFLAYYNPFLKTNIVKSFLKENSRKNPGNLKEC